MVYPNDNPKLWKGRRDALLQRIGDLNLLCNKADAATLPRGATLSALLEGLQAFGGDYFTYFYDGFPAGKLVVSHDFPPEHVLSVALSQIGYDLDVIERAIMQRLRGTATEKDVLAKADALAWAAIQPAFKNQPADPNPPGDANPPADANERPDPNQPAIKNQSVIANQLKLKKTDVTSLTYFHKSPNIRVMPYARVMLIGIPYTVTSTPIDYLAIPHEVGHYVFWTRESTQDWWAENIATGKKSDRAFKVWWKQTAGTGAAIWWEELFADVYAALIGGPVEALDFQEQALQNSRAGFMETKGKHPAPVLRPRIFNKIVALGDWGGLGDKLDACWEERRRQRVSRTSWPKMNPLIGGELSLDRGHPVDRLIDVAHQMLSGVTSKWFRDVAGCSVEQLSEELESRVGALVKDAVQPPDQAETVDFNKWLSKFPAATASPMPVREWLPVFKADDWTAGGGENDPAH